MVGWHNGGASREQNTNAGNDSSNRGESSTDESESTVEKLQHNQGNWEQSQLVPVTTPGVCACSQELEHFHIHQGFTNSRVKGPGDTTHYHDEQ